MKKRNARFSFLGTVIFFVTICITVTVAMLIYGYVDAKSYGDRRVISATMFLVIVFLALICTLIDVIRRRKMIDEPVERILNATERIASGDFSVRLHLEHAYEKYDEYDLIMENLNLMAEELGKSEVLKTDFISNVSHELKTPLAVIKSYAGLLRHEEDLEKRKKYVGILCNASDKLSDLITNILKLNKLENEKIMTDRQAVRLDEQLAEAALNFEDIIEKKGIELVCDLEELTAHTLPGYLEIVWNNLLSNAVKFTEEGGRVEVTLKKEDGNAVVRVSDTGCGISAETGAHIFEKFYQGDTSHAQEGNGLGLALVKKVIQILGGSISVESEEGKGSTFTVLLKEGVL